MDLFFGVVFCGKNHFRAQALMSNSISCALRCCLAQSRAVPRVHIGFNRSTARWRRWFNICMAVRPDSLMRPEHWLSQRRLPGIDRRFEESEVSGHGATLTSTRWSYWWLISNIGRHINCRSLDLLFDDFFLGIVIYLLWSVWRCGSSAGLSAIAKGICKNYTKQIKDEVRECSHDSRASLKESSK